MGWMNANYLLLLHRFQDFDDALLIVDCVDALKHLTILASAHFSHNLVVVLVPVWQ